MILGEPVKIVGSGITVLLASTMRCLKDYVFFPTPIFKNGRLQKKREKLVGIGDFGYGSIRFIQCKSGVILGLYDFGLVMMV